MNLDALRQFFRDNPRMWAISGAALVVAALVGLWAFGGFSFIVSRFFAGQEPLPSTVSGNCGPAVSEGGDFSWDLQTNNEWGDCADGSAPTYWITTNVGTCHPNGLHLVWRAEHRAQASCDIALAGDPISEGQGITTQVSNFSAMDLPDGQGGSATMTYNPTTFTCGSVRLWGAFWASGPESAAKNGGYNGYYKVINYGRDCGGIAGGGTTPSQAPTPPVFCSPQTQTVQVGTLAHLEASGGNGLFQWDTGSGVVQSGGNEAVDIVYRVAGQKSVRVSSGTSSTFCTVTVQATPTPVAVTGGLTVQKMGANSSAGQTTPSAIVADIAPGQTVQFTTTITNSSGTAVTGLVMRDQVPVGMSYQFGSTTVEGQAVTSDALTSGDGLWLGRLENGDSVSIRWIAIADQTIQLPAGRQTVSVSASATTDQGLTGSGILGFAIIGGSVPIGGVTGGATGGTTTGGSVTTAGGVQTGPADVILLSLGAAALIALLYAGYTRSPAFRRRELERFSRTRDVQDFRN